MDTITDRAPAVIDTTATETPAYLPNEDGELVDEAWGQSVPAPPTTETPPKAYVHSVGVMDLDPADVTVRSLNTCAHVELGPVNVYGGHGHLTARESLLIIRSIGNAIVDQASDLLDQIADAEAEAAMAAHDDAEFQADLHDRSVA